MGDIINYKKRQGISEYIANVAVALSEGFDELHYNDSATEMKNFIAAISVLYFHKYLTKDTVQKMYEVIFKTEHELLKEGERHKVVQAFQLLLADKLFNEAINCDGDYPAAIAELQARKIMVPMWCYMYSDCLYKVMGDAYLDDGKYLYYVDGIFNEKTLRKLSVQDIYIGPNYELLTFNDFSQVISTRIDKLIKVDDEKKILYYTYRGNTMGNYFAEYHIREDAEVVKHFYELENFQTDFPGLIIEKLFETTAKIDGGDTDLSGEKQIGVEDMMIGCFSIDSETKELYFKKHLVCEGITLWDITIPRDITLFNGLVIYDNLLDKHKIYYHRMLDDNELKLIFDEFNILNKNVDIIVEDIKSPNFMVKKHLSTEMEDYFMDGMK
ncbi:MAG: hypothetical protein IJO70_00875 [Lachnospiraceae bacterium]|nr:hypothetical protein [Lachnospiraceae bacterium]